MTAIREVCKPANCQIKDPIIYSLLFFLCSGFCRVALVLCGFALRPSRVLSVYSQFTAVDNSVDHRKWLLIF